MGVSHPGRIARISAATIALVFRELGDFRTDIYVPLCYDAAGTKSLLRVKMEAAAFR